MFFIGFGLSDTFARSLLGENGYFIGFWHFKIRMPFCTNNYLNNKSGLFSCPDRILDYFSYILFTFSTTFILITKLKSLSVLNLSVRLSVCLSVFLSFYYLSDIQLTFWTSFVLMSKLKNLSFCFSFCLSVCLAVCRSLCLSFWHPVDILSNFCFDN